MSVANTIKTCMVMEGRDGARAARELDTLLENTGVTLEPVTVAQFVKARQAWHLFGKGNHPAGLNFGDCFAYALAKTAVEQLLFRGRFRIY